MFRWGESILLHACRERDVLRFCRTGIGSDLWMQVSLPANSRISEGVWNDFSGRLRSFVSKRVKEPADADDIVQEIFRILDKFLNILPTVMADTRESPDPR